MPSILLVPPAVEPLPLAEAKQFLRIEHGDDDAVIAALVTAARTHVEAATRRALITQTWRLVRDAWPRAGRLAITPAPLRQLMAARIYRQDGTTQALDGAAFVVDTAASELVYRPCSVPAPGRRAAGIEIDVEVGFGATPAAVPEPLRQAVRMLIAHWYENRGLAGPGAVFPAGVERLIAPYRVLSP